jgi:Arc/MetJ-type ribon-helix-helix transcriptional regulator
MHTESSSKVLFVTPSSPLCALDDAGTVLAETGALNIPVTRMGHLLRTKLLSQPSAMSERKENTCVIEWYDVSSYPEERMPKAKVAVTLDTRTLRRVDRLVRDARYPNRSQAIEAAVAEQLDRLERRRLVEECAKLDPVAERAMAEEGLGEDAAGWPEY